MYTVAFFCHIQLMFHVPIQISYMQIKFSKASHTTGIRLWNTIRNISEKILIINYGYILDKKKIMLLFLWVFTYGTFSSANIERITAEN
jgi:hypothetical protein